MTLSSLRQEQILSFIRQFMQDNQCAPTRRDIQDGLDISSTSVVDYNLKLLERKGRVQLLGHSRGILLVGESCCPYCGSPKLAGFDGMKA